MYTKQKYTTIAVVVLVLITVAGKVTLQPNTVVPLIEAGIGERYVYVLAIIEVIAVLFYIFPKTFRIGFLLLTAYYGGAIAFNFPSLVDMVPAIIFMTLIWTLTYIREPSIFIEP